MDKSEIKVRTRSPLPSAMRVPEWLDMVVRSKPAVNRLGALAFWEYELCVIAYLGRQVHAIKMADARAGSALTASLNEDDLSKLESWLNDYDAGKFSTLIDKEKSRSISW